MSAALPSPQPTLRAAIIALLKGAQERARAFTEVDTAEVRDEHATDISTKADRELSRYFVSAVEQALPDAALWTEETGGHRDSGRALTLVVDEIDGTDNFFRAREFLPWCSVVTVFRGDSPRFGDALVAGIVDHLSGCLWSAESGKGCFEQRPGGVERKVGVSQRSILDRRSLVIVDHYSAGPKVAALTTLNAKAWVKDFGSSAFHGALLCSGRVDAYVNLAHKAHELGAIALLCKEAGGSIGLVGGGSLESEPVDMEGSWGMVAAQSAALARALAEIVELGKKN